MPALPRSAIRLGGVARRLARTLAGLLAAGACAFAAAGTLDREEIGHRLPPPLVVGERDAQWPVWPVFRQDLTTSTLAGYVFESVDLAPIPGFSGTPPDLLVALDTQGRFLDVQVVSQHEPVFLDGLGPVPLLRFVEQYRGLSLRQNIKIGSNANRTEQRGSANVYIDGVAKATASVRIVNQALLASALKVARAKLGYAAGRDPQQVAHVRSDGWRPLDWNGLVSTGLVAHLRLSHGQVLRAFEGSGVELGMGGAPDDTFTELWVAYLNTPLVGRNLLDEAGWTHLQGRIDEGDHALLVIGRGPWTFVGDDWVRGAVPDRITLRQAELPLEARDLDLDDPLRLPPSLRGADTKVLRVIGPAGLDPALPIEFNLHVVRSKGQVYAERIARDFTLGYSVPEALLSRPAANEQDWRTTWRSRAGELAITVAALALLSWVLMRPAWIVADARRLARFRVGYLLFTLVFVGWVAQGQLSIVNLTAFVQALVGGRGLGFFLYDPMTVLLWAYVLATLLVWGRGTFCGWLCPFGALQELVGGVARRLGLEPRRLPTALDRRLKLLKFAVLALVVALAAGGAATAAWTDRAVEFEPFKTAITLVFARSAPFVAWAGLLLALSLAVYKGFCRYLCPLGAALALLGRVRRLDWIARRAECGTPCQTCRHRCDYQAITPAGAVVYDECFQCLECVAIHASDERCAPRIQARRQRVIAIRPLPARAPVGRGRPDGGQA